MRFFLFLAVFVCNNLVGQLNLVPNPSFEIYDTCPMNLGNNPLSGKICRAFPWLSPAQFNNLNCEGSSTDFWHTCNGSVPFNFLLGFQYPRTGNGYAGVGVVYAPGFEAGREYLEVPLLSTLKPKK